MRNVKVIFLFAILSGCYSAKKAEKSLNKAQLYFPEVVAKKTTQWYPCKVSDIKSDSSLYKKWSKEIDSLSSLYSEGYPDSVLITDTIIDSFCCHKLNIITSLINKKKGNVATIINKAKSVPALHDTIIKIDSAGNWLKNKAIEDCQSDSKRIYNKYDKSRSFNLYLLILLVLSLLLNAFFFYKNK